MKIRIPRAYDATMDWIACHILPPNKPTGLRLLGYPVTWLDLALFFYPAIAAGALWAWSGNWLWFPAVAGSMAFAWVVWGWK